jgi:hypothetical protein
MAVRNRFLAFFYRLFLLAIGGYALYLLYKYHTQDVNDWTRPLYYFDFQTLLVAFVVIFAEVIANAIGLPKKTNGVVPGVWSPLFLASLSFTFSISPVTRFFFVDQSGFLCGTASTSCCFSKIIFPSLLLGDYLLFGEKGTVKWKHPDFLEPLSPLLFCLLLLVKAVWQQGFSAVVSSSRTLSFQTGRSSAGNGGWNGVVIFSFLAYLCYFALAYLYVFLNNVFAGAYRRSDPSDVI